MSADTIIYEKQGHEVRLAALSEGKLSEIAVYNDISAVEGNVYLGKVVQKLDLAGGRTGFRVNIGDEQDAFLNGFEVESKEVNLTEGQSIVVQVIQEKHAEKGAKVARNIQVVGTTLVYRPFWMGVEVSSKIEDLEKAKLYQNTVRENITGQEGWTVRTAAVEYPLDQVLEEMVKLRGIYENIRVKARNISAPALLYARENPLFEIIRRHKESLRKVVANNHSLLQDVNTVAEAEIGMFSASPFTDFGLEEQIEEARQRTVALPSGGKIHIEQTRACVCIDVDSGGKKASGAVSRLNEEAAQEIARQIVLKNLAGKIIIDFAGSSEYRYIRPVLDILQARLADDPYRARVLGLSKAGNVEIVRPRRRPSLLDIYTEECSNCQGTGRVEK